MRETDPAMEPQQFEHLINCQLCRMICGQIDCHPSQGWDNVFSFDFMVELLSKCLESLKTDKPNFNNCPLISDRYHVDNKGGLYIAPGKSSHSTYKIQGTHFVKFRESAGYKAASHFLVFKLTSQVQAGKGSFFCKMTLFYDDAIQLLNHLKLFCGNQVSIAHFDKAAKAIQMFCRKCPNNIVREDKHGPCAMILYTEIYNSSTLSFCNKCSDMCVVNKQLIAFFEHIINFYMSLNFRPKTSLRFIFGSTFVEKFLSHCVISGPHATLEANHNFVFPLHILD